MGINTHYILVEFYKMVQCRNDKELKLFCRMEKFQSDVNVIGACKDCKKENTEKKNIKQLKLTDGMNRTLRYVKVV